MKPTDEQLRDPKWWDENCKDETTAYFHNEKWHYRPNTKKIHQNLAGLEWDGETFIQAGHRLQARVNDNPWLSGEITYRSDSGVVFRPDDGGDELFWRFALFDVEFRPLRTKEQRQREELANDIANDLEAYGIDNPKHLASCLAIGMINRGWHKGEQ